MEGLKWTLRGSGAPGACGLTLVRLWVWHMVTGGLVGPRSLGGAPISSLLCKCSNNGLVKPQPAHPAASDL